MTDINTSNSTVTTNKSKKELKQEQRNKKFQDKLVANKAKKLAQLEKKKANLTVMLNRTNNPKKKSSYQDRIDEIDIKIKNLNDPAKAEIKRPFGLVMRTWSKGLGKEAGRIAWYKRGQVLKDFVTIILVCAFLAIIFFAIDMIIISIR